MPLQASRWTVLTIGCLLGATAAAAQTPVSVGVMGGLTLANFGGSDAIGTSTRTGVSLGGVLSFGLSDRVTLQTGLVYSQRGAKVEQDDFDGTIKLPYVEVPALFQLRFPSGNVTPFFSAGPAVAFRTGCTVALEGSGASVSVPCDQADVDLTSSDLSLAGAVGILVRQLSFELRYNYGLSKLIANDEAEVYNRVITLSAGYHFQLR